MALSPKATYPGQLNETDPGYPHGKAQNVVVAGDGTGTPWEERLVNDILGFQQSLLGAAKITPSGTADKVGASQYLDALKALIEMAPATKGRNWPERASVGDSGATANEDVGIAYGPANGPNS